MWGFYESLTETGQWHWSILFWHLTCSLGSTRLASPLLEHRSLLVLLCSHQLLLRSPRRAPLPRPARNTAGPAAPSSVLSPRGRCGLGPDCPAAASGARKRPALRAGWAGAPTPHVRPPRPSPPAFSAAARARARAAERQRRESAQAGGGSGPGGAPAQRPQELQQLVLVLGEESRAWGWGGRRKAHSTGQTQGSAPLRTGARHTWQQTATLFPHLWHPLRFWNRGTIQREVRGPPKRVKGIFLRDENRNKTIKNQVIVL